MSRITSMPVLASTLALTGFATMASAQSASLRVGGAPAQPAAAPLGGPVIAGICLLSREAIFANAEVGKVATARLLELTKAAQAEIDNERTPLETEARTLETKRTSLSADQLRQRSEALANRWQALQQKAAHNGREIEATRAKALDRIATEAQPVIAQVYAGKNCGLLLDRGAALGGNYANDLTAGVVEGLNARIRTISFERERLPAQPATNGQGQRSQ